MSSSLSGFGGSTFGNSTQSNNNPLGIPTQPSSNLFGISPPPFSRPSGVNSTDAPGTTPHPFVPTTETEPCRTPSQTIVYQNIALQDCYKKWSAEELRLADYKHGLTGASTQESSGTTRGAFGTGISASTGGGFGNSTTNGGFGSSTTGAGLFSLAADSQTGRTVTTTNSSSGTAFPTPTSSSHSPPTQPSRPAGAETSGSDTKGPISASALRKNLERLTTTDSGAEDANSASPPEFSNTKTKPAARKSDLDWLSERYSGTTAVYLGFYTDDKNYFFAKEVLTRNFGYFRNALKDEEGEDGEVEDGEGEDGTPTNCNTYFDFRWPPVTTAAFARLVRWSQTDESEREDAAKPDSDEYKIADLLHELIAAHELGLGGIQEFERHTRCLLATILLKDRRKLKGEDIKLAEKVDAVKAKLKEGSGQAIVKAVAPVAEIFQRAGVRPLLQLTMLSTETQLTICPCPGHGDRQEWLDIVRHCRQLREENETYGKAVTEMALEMLATCRRSMDGPPAFEDPLDDDEVKGRRKLGFQTSFTM